MYQFDLPQDFSPLLPEHEAKQKQALSKWVDLRGRLQVSIGTI
jgi:hypothetical protein